MVAWAQRRRSGRTHAARRGFTLLETLVVVGVIVTLVAALVPVLLRARGQAASMGCASNLRAVGQALNLARTERGSYPQPDPSTDPTTCEALDSIGKHVPRRLLDVSLGRPESLFCPTSLKYDPCTKYSYCPFVKRPNGQINRQWETGQISYIYLVGVRNEFSDGNGQPTFDPQREAPDLTRSPRVVLAGDRTVELAPNRANIPGSNHGREGGWFCFTTGDVQWWSWNRLAAHPGRIYTWYWPKLAQPQQQVSASSGGS